MCNTSDVVGILRSHHTIVKISGKKLDERKQKGCLYLVFRDLVQAPSTKNTWMRIEDHFDLLFEEIIVGPSVIVLSNVRNVTVGKCFQTRSKGKVFLVSSNNDVVDFFCICTAGEDVLSMLQINELKVVDGQSISAWKAR